jgi:hypothetical protein
MPWYKVELNLGISNKLADYIVATYGGGGQNIKIFERAGNYTKIIAFAANITAINTALNDIRNHLVEVEETTYSPGSGD